jgi:hypothetical protein
MLAKVNIKQPVAYLLLAILLMMVDQYVISISDPTQNVIQNGQQGLKVDYWLIRHYWYSNHLVKYLGASANKPIG